MKPGEIFYLKRATRHVAVTVVALYEFQGGTAKVVHSEGGEETTCLQSELISSEAYEAHRKQVAQEQYARDLPVRKAEARERLKDVVQLWEAGNISADMMRLATNTGTARSWAQRIRSAKNWGFIKEAKSDEPIAADQPDVR